MQSKWHIAVGMAMLTAVSVNIGPAAGQNAKPITDISPNVVIPRPLAQALLIYLAERPYREVVILINGLTQAMAPQQVLPPPEK